MQADIGKELKIHKASYGRYELDKSKPNPIDIAEIANLLRLDINFFFLPDMKPYEADLDETSRAANMDDISRKLEALKEQITPSEKFDPLLYYVKTHTDVKRLVQRLQGLNVNIAKRLYDKIDGFLTAIEEAQEATGKEEEGAG